MMPIKNEDIENQSSKNNILLSTMMGHQQQHHHQQQQPQQQQSSQLPTSNSLSKAEIRKNNKPIMEKKRRARINHCLNELKTLILEALKKDPARHTKLEKADILEMTVKHLQTVQRKQVAMSVNTDPTVVHKFKSGFADCAEEVTRYISQLDGIDTGVKQRLSSHLKTCISGLQQTTPFSVAGAFNGNLAATVGINASLQGNNDLSHDLNNNRRIQMGEMQLIPSRLPTGELALIMPNSSNLPFFPTSAFAPPSSVDLSLTYPRMSAFNTVSKTLIGHMSSSPPLSPMSSISCCDDDSLQSSDYHPLAVTPPLQNNLSNLFPTPPSGGSSGKPSVSNLQQSQVSSTTETTAKTQPLSVLTNNNNINLGNNSTPNCRPDAYVNKKRPYPVNISDSLLNTSNDYVESPKKIMKLNPPMAESSDDSSQNSDNEQNQLGANDAMWRPW